MSDVPKADNLVRRGAVYYCRMRCPTHLLREGVPPEKWLSLQTKERSEALERLHGARAEIMAFFRGDTPRFAVSSGIASASPRLRRPSHPDLPILRAEEVAALTQALFASSLKEMELRTADVGELDDEGRARWREELEDRLAALDHSADEDPAAGAEIAVLRKAGRRASYDSEPSRLLRSYIRRAQRQLLLIELARMRGDFRDVIADRLFQPMIAASASVTTAAVGRQTHLRDLVTRFVGSEIDGDEEITPKTREKNKAALRIVERFFGADRAVATITGRDCRAFRDTLASLPPNLTKRADGADPLDRLAQANVEGGGRSMSRATQSLYLRSLDRLLAFAKAEGLISDNPYPEKLAPKAKRQAREKARNAYSDAQLRAIFSSPLYTGCVDDERNFAVPLPGNVVRRSRFWLPLISLFSGMRMGEILQLTKWHVQTAPDELPCFLIGADMRLKTRASYRVVPMHEELIRIGLPSFVAALEEDDAPLFGDVEPGPDGYRSSTFSKRYATFFRSLGAAEPGRQVSFHSFRHNFRDALRLPDVNPDLTREVGGWSRGKDVSDSYGDGARAVVLRPIVNRACYQIDLGHLYCGSGA